MDGFSPKNYINKKLILDCHKVTLFKNDKNEQHSYSGPGSIYQDNKGKLLLKLFTTDDKSLKRLFGGSNKVKLGKIIPSSEYYKLKAIDMNGNEWESTYVRPLLHVASNPKNIVIIANLRAIKRVQKISIKFNKSEVILRLDKSIELPWGTYIEENTTMAKTENKEHLFNTFANFIIAPYEFIFQKDQDYLNLVIRSENKSKIPDYICVRIQEALEFVLAHKIEIFIKEFYYSSYDVVEIISNDLTNTSDYKSDMPPIKHDNNKEVWQLFKKYYMFISQNKTRGYHPLSKYVNQILLTKSHSTNARGTALSIVVEGILKNFFLLKKKKTNIYDEDIAKAKSIFKSTTFSEKFTTRINNFLGSIKNIYAKDVLFELIDDKTIKKKLLTSWNELRNRTVHGEQLELEKLNRYLKWYYDTKTLYYLLIFLIIKYDGIYSDYSVPNWKTKQFNKSKI